MSSLAVAAWVALGSAVGGVARYWGSGLAARAFGDSFPWGTLFVNVSGSLAIGLVWALTGPDGRLPIGTTGREFVMIGILGGFTTFSTFSLETLALLESAQWLPAGFNVVGSVALCLAAVWLGQALGLAVSR